MNQNHNLINRSKRLISFQTGILRNVVRASRLNGDPNTISFGISTCDTLLLNGQKYEGRSSGCNYDLYNAYMSTIGETVERYCPAFFNLDKMKKCSYNDRDFDAINPHEFALFHSEQKKIFNEQKYKIQSFDETTNVYWDSCFDLTTGRETFCPSASIYLPWLNDDIPILYGVSTGLSAHSNFHKAVLTSLYEVIERDSFVLTWYQMIVPPKIIITKEIEDYISEKFPTNYEWHFFDITYDLNIPTVFGICFGESDYGKFVSVSTATRHTIGEALKKVILEIAQAVPYFRFSLNAHKEWCPSDDFNKILNFEQHSLFYIKKPEYLFVFDRWRNATPSKKIDFNSEDSQSTKQKILEIIRIMKEKKYNVLIKDLTTPDVVQGGFFSVRVIIPQLLQMSGSYPFYFLGGKRLYDVPSMVGYTSHSFENLNKYPHPFL